MPEDTGRATAFTLGIQAIADLWGKCPEFSVIQPWAVAVTVTLALAYATIMQRPA